jgi:hypothetical protein
MRQGPRQNSVADKPESAAVESRFDMQARGIWHFARFFMMNDCILQQMMKSSLYCTWPFGAINRNKAEIAMWHGQCLPIIRVGCPGMRGE